VVVHESSFHAVRSSSVTLRAYLLDSDGAYTDVTQTAEWRFAEPSAVQSLGIHLGGFGFIRAPGSTGTRVLAQAGSVSGEISVSWQQSSSIRTPPFLEVSVLPALRLAESLQVRATFTPSNAAPQNVTSAALWSSSDPAVARVEGTQLVGTGVGTTEVVGTFQGTTDRLMVSVLPRWSQP